MRAITQHPGGACTDGLGKIMSNISSRINLAQLQHVVEKRKTKSGEQIDVITLPIKNNNLFLSDKGNVFLDLIAFEVAPEKRKTEDTHLVKQSLDKKASDAMTDQEKRDMPILGNMKVWGHAEATPQQATDMPEPDGDLPF